MSHNRKANILVTLIFLGVIIAFAYSYNSYVTMTVANAAYNDREILQDYNNEIIRKLISKDSVSEWSEIVEQYEDIVIVIENSSNKVVTKSIGRTWTALDVKVQTPFEFGGEAYLIKSSVYLLRDYVGDVRKMVEFIFMEFLISISALGVLVIIIYNAVVRYYGGLYKAIEEYEKTGKLKKIVLKGYAGRIYDRFESLTQNLERQQQNQRRIIASISHDIKTPLTSIMGYAERLNKEGISEERRKIYLDTVYGKSVEIQRLVNEFDEYLGFNVPEQMKTEAVTAKEIISFVEREYQEELALAGVDLRTANYAEEATVMIDKIKFKRVFGNIFSNSLKHFVNEKKIIDFEVACDKNKIYISISDNGEGVEEEKLDMIFEPLYTSDKGRKVAGLGLAICREIVESHMGKIYAENSVNSGLTIRIELDRSDKKPRLF
ncbi:MAG: HAMP domain-containing histidine kinase [Clostridia bacterium]|nr:HAMP domain-containing histidine kinase [Clostridia bacterium]